MRSFFDTNILVYLFDQDNPDKKKRAQNLLEREAAAGRALLSTQVLQEFYVTVTRKIAVPIDAEEAEEAVRQLTLLPHVEVNSRHILRAIRRSGKMRLSFWDALIIEAAIEGDADTLFSEDLSDGQVIGKLTIRDPFTDPPF